MNSKIVARFRWNRPQEFGQTTSHRSSPNRSNTTGKVLELHRVRVTDPLEISREPFGTRRCAGVVQESVWLLPPAGTDMHALAHALRTMWGKSPSIPKARLASHRFPPHGGSPAGGATGAGCGFESQLGGDVFVFNRRLFIQSKSGRSFQCSIFSHMFPPGLLSPCSPSGPSPPFGSHPASSRAILSHPLCPPSAELFRLLDLEQRLVLSEAFAFGVSADTPCLNMRASAGALGGEGERDSCGEGGHMNLRLHFLK